MMPVCRAFQFFSGCQDQAFLKTEGQGKSPLKDLRTAHLFVDWETLSVDETVVQWLYLNYLNPILYLITR